MQSLRTPDEHLADLADYPFASIEEDAPPQCSQLIIDAIAASK